MRYVVNIRFFGRTCLRRIFQLTRKPFLCDMILGKQEVDDVIR